MPKKRKISLVLADVDGTLVTEQKVLTHHYVGGHSSYSFVQRPMAEPPFLLMHPVEDTSFECMYKSSAQGRGGPDFLAVHSHAQRDINRWTVPWVNGHTSLVLQPGWAPDSSVRTSSPRTRSRSAPAR